MKLFDDKEENVTTGRVCPNGEFRLDPRGPGGDILIKIEIVRVHGTACGRRNQPEEPRARPRPICVAPAGPRYARGLQGIQRRPCDCAVHLESTRRPVDTAVCDLDRVTDHCLPKRKLDHCGPKAYNVSRANPLRRRVKSTWPPFGLACCPNWPPFPAEAPKRRACALRRHP